jgi:hypothetical protein
MHAQNMHLLFACLGMPPMIQQDGIVHLREFNVAVSDAYSIITRYRHSPAPLDARAARSIEA